MCIRDRFFQLPIEVGRLIPNTVKPNGADGAIVCLLYTSQGQSPYLINAGFFYQHADSGWNAALLYNRIGKRIIGVGRSLGKMCIRDRLLLFIQDMIPY